MISAFSMQSLESQTNPYRSTGLWQKRHFGLRTSRHQAFSFVHMAAILLLLAFGVTAGAQEKPDSPKPQDGVLHQFDPSLWTAQSDRPANKAFWAGAALTGASSLGPWIGGNICRHNNGVEPCTEHYGGYYAWNGILTGATVFAAPALFYGCRKENHNARWCWAIPGIVIGGNVGWGIHEAQIHHPDLADSVTRRKK